MLTELLAPDYPQMIATELKLKSPQTKIAIRLLEDGNTIPFIARYRKEMTGMLDENQLREISARFELLKSLYQRKCDVLRLLGEQGVLEDESRQRALMAALSTATTLTEVDDIYRPYRPKRKTRASVARERGLEPLARWLTHPDRLEATEAAVIARTDSYTSVEKGVATVEDALNGAMDIVAEEIADDASSRKWIRTRTMKRGSVSGTAVDVSRESVYEQYYDYMQPLSKVLPHHILAMNRGEREGYLKVSVSAPTDEILTHLWHQYVQQTLPRIQNKRLVPESFIGCLLERTIADAYRRLLQPAIEREIRAGLTDKAEEQAILIFAENLRNLLMQPPIRGKVVLGVDPAYRTGCKLAVVDDTGKLLETAVVYPTPPQSKVEAAKQVMFRMMAQYHAGLIAIGNGTASRETEAFVSDCSREFNEQCGIQVPYVIVSEAGASVYSASVLAGEEFPDLDVSERSAVSIARRIQDPLAELVKIDPKSIGVGQYQHDVSQKKLDNQLTAVVESAVNRVGVDVNTASPSLLSYVSGLNRTVAGKIVEFRAENGRFSNRKMLAKVARLGPKTLEQCVGFLRISDGDEPLDATPIHPESYEAVSKLLKHFGQSRTVVADERRRREWIDSVKAIPAATLSVELGIGVPTLLDILDALERPGRDPRDDVPTPMLRTDILKLEDLEVGMVLTGTVRNVVDFGAFVDIGIKNDGLVHISQLADRFVKHPMDVVAVGDIVQVRVIQIDANRGKVGLSMKGV